MLDHLYEHERCALWAGMGMGKTGTVLSYLDGLYMAGESAPTLILGPKRVARSTWSNEARKWDDFKHLGVSPIIGTEKERLAALRRDVPIYTVNYESMVWLIDHYGDRWPFKTVIADESTRLKGHRISFRTSSKGKEFLAG
jgi:SNF2 family DNA or RNA helicase